MGNTWVAAVQDCSRKCKNSKVVLSVRDPYAWYHSLYKWSWGCSYTEICTQRHFEEFMQWIASEPSQHTQSNIVFKSCGDPCRFDHLIRAETLQQDWISLLQRYKLPLIALPAVSEGPAFNNQGKRTPPTNFTSKVLDIIHRIDERMFKAPFGYTKRRTPFSL